MSVIKLLDVPVIFGYYFATCVSETQRGFGADNARDECKIGRPRSDS